MAIEILQLFFPPKVQNKRTMASSDMQAARNHLSTELDGIKQKQTKLRERVGLPSRSRSIAFSDVFFGEKDVGLDVTRFSGDQASSHSVKAGLRPCSFRRRCKGMGTGHPGHRCGLVSESGSFCLIR